MISTDTTTTAELEEALGHLGYPKTVKMDKVLSELEKLTALVEQVIRVLVEAGVLKLDQINR